MSEIRARGPPMMIEQRVPLDIVFSTEQLHLVGPRVMTVTGARQVLVHYVRMDEKHAPMFIIHLAQLDSILTRLLQGNQMYVHVIRTT